MNNILLIEKVDKFLEVLGKDEIVIKYLEAKDAVLLDKVLLNKIEYFHSLIEGSNEYKKVKHELFQNEIYKRYLSYEQEIFYLILEINSRLKTLVKKEGCIK